MIIKVEQQDIDDAMAGSCSFCPVALALHRQIPPPRGANPWKRPMSWLVELTHASYPININERRRFDLPPSVVEFTRNFDNPHTRHNCVPFTFELFDDQLTDIPKEKSCQTSL